jgi:hypothetical protein
LDLRKSTINEAKVWIDAVQFEKSKQTTEYQVSAPVEITAETEKEGNIFVCAQPPYDIPLKLRAFNNTALPQEVKASISVKDFWDNEVIHKEVNLSVKPREEIVQIVSLPVGKLGFYRITVFGQTSKLQLSSLPSQQLRCMIINPADEDSRFGMNHAYPWNFLLRLSGEFGVSWWRDWSVRWNTVQAEKDGQFDFSEPDIQIDRVLKEGKKVIVLFPFPATLWAKDDKINFSDPNIKNLATDQKRLQCASRPRDEKAFVNYIRESVKHYKNRINVYQVFNEPLFTEYSLPALLGYKVEDYIHFLSLAYKTIKAEQPDATVIGGIGIWADSKWARDFVKAGGLQFVDILDVHDYPIPLRPEELCEPLAEMWKTMKERNEAKPIWMTELGCYADDDPAQTAGSFGDAAMQRSLHSSETEAAEWFVKFAAIFFANGGEKIFLHAGVSGEINGTDLAGIFFEYGGAPRKICPAVAAMASFIPVSAKFEKTEKMAEKVTVYWFSTPKGEVGVGWAEDGKRHKVKLASGIQAFDIMGNISAGSTIEFTGTPLYLVRK